MPTTPRGFPLLTAGQQYALVTDYNKLATKADAEATVTEARAQETADAARAYAEQVAAQTRTAAVNLSNEAKVIANEAMATVRPVRELVDTANTKSDHAVATAEAAYAYNQALVAPAADVVNAVVTDPATPAGALVDSKVYVGDTYVGVTQQPGATMKDKLHAALAEASASGGVVMLPDEPIDVGTGLSLSGYGCGIVGRGGGTRQTANGSVPVGSAIYASQQSGPVVNFEGFVWDQGYRSTLPFENFTIRGSNTPDPTRANVGIRNIGMYGGTAHGGAGVGAMRNVTITGCGGGAVYWRKIYLFHMENVTVMMPPQAAANNTPAFIGENVSGCNIRMTIYSDEASGNVPIEGAFILRDWYEVHPTSGEVFWHSTRNKVDVQVEYLHPGTNSSIIHSESNENEFSVRLFDVTKETGATNSSIIRLAPPQHATNAGGNLVHGIIPGDGGGGDKAWCDYGVVVSQPRNSIVGRRSFRSNNVLLEAGVTGTYVNLNGSWGAHPSGKPGVVDRSGQPGKNTLLDHVAYPYDGRNPNPAYKTADTVRNNSTATPVDPDLRCIVEAGATYRVEAIVPYTSSVTADFQAGLSAPVGSTTSMVIDGIGQDAKGGYGASMTRSGSSGGALPLGGVGSRTVARITGTVTASVTGIVSVTWGQATAEASDTTVHAGGVLKLERIA